MNILVTVGFTAFDQLIEAVDRQFSPSDFCITCQIASGGYQPQSHPFIRVSDKLTDMIEEADLVITHGGAATVFELLETGKPIVLVPNMYRLDKHQGDLADFIETNQYGGVCRDLATLQFCVETCRQTNFKPYEKESFFLSRDILQYFGIAEK